MRKFFHFLQYNNAIPIALFILFGGTGAVFASSPDAREAVLSSTDVVQSVDNTYIVGVDLTDRDFGLQVVDVREDEEMYYVKYRYNTISVVDYVWKEVEVEKTMEISKKELVGKDLGLFVAKQLGEEMTAELAYLSEVQQSEREKGASLKVVATEYSGLIGRMLDPEEKTFDGYRPVVEEADDDQTASVASIAPGESHLALPPIPTTQAIQQIVATAVQAALAGQGATTTPAVDDSDATSTASTTPPTDDDEDDTDTGSGSGSSTGTSTPTTPPPTDQNPATSTPSTSATTTPSTPTNTNTATTTPPTSDPEPTSEPEPDTTSAPETESEPEPEPTPEEPVSTETGTTTAAQ